ncbi:MAG: ATP-binding protein [Candidatus Obscuribacterales bacterium]|nr:ATP-binding protein [Candidatus Obscuribacterales bacterium]
MNFFKKLIKNSTDTEITKSVTSASTPKEVSFGVRRKKYDALLAAKDLSETLWDLAKELACNPQHSYLGALKFTDPKDIKEPNEFLSSISPALSEMQSRTYFRWKAVGATKSLSVRATQNLVEIFIIPNQLAMFLSISEFGTRLKATINLRRENNNYIWLMDERPLDKPSATKMLLNYLVDTANQTAEISAIDIDIPENSLQDRHNHQVDGLLLANQNLLFKLVNQQEETRNEIARELHDSVLADLMMLKRYISGDKELSKEEMGDIVDDITKQLRDIVNECTPKTLNEWGLKVSLDTLLQKLHERQGTECKFECPNEITRLPEIVELNIYRIFQECINNIAKYAFATQVNLRVRCTRQKTTFILTDNGRGFAEHAIAELHDDSVSNSARGYGLRSMQERAELIRCFLPTRLNVDSKAGTGTTVILEIESGHDFA